MSSRRQGSSGPLPQDAGSQGAVCSVCPKAVLLTCHTEPCCLTYWHPLLSLSPSSHSAWPLLTPFKARQLLCLAHFRAGTLPSPAAAPCCSATGSMPPSAYEVRAVFRQFLRLGRQFPNYNIREYIKRKAKEDIRSYAALSDQAAADAAWKRAMRELEVFKRQSLVYQLYARKMRNVLEIDQAAEKAARLRPAHAT